MRKYVLLAVLILVAVGAYRFTNLKYWVQNRFITPEEIYIATPGAEKTLAYFHYDPELEQVVRAEVNKLGNRDEYGYQLLGVWPPFLRKMFVDGKYVQLTEILDGLQKKVEKDVRLEYELWDAYMIFYWPILSLEGHFDKWLEQDRSYVPYLARSYYYASLAGRGRGSDWASQTREERFKLYDKYNAKAEKDLTRALELYPGSFVALVSHADDAVYASGDHALAEKRYETTLSLYPDSFILHRRRIKAWVPRWGGSYDMMTKAIRQAMEHVDTNPRLELTKGIVYEDQSDIARLNDDDELGFELLGKALSKSRFSVYYYELGYRLHKEKKHDEGYAYITRAISQRPTVPIYHAARGDINNKYGKYDVAVTDYLIANQLDPFKFSNDKISQIYYKWALYYSDDEKKRAVEFMDLALRINPEDPEFYKLRGMCLAGIGDEARAKVDFEKGLSLAPDDIDNWRRFAYQLIDVGEGNRVIERWDRQIVENPRDQDAIYERINFYLKLEMPEMAIPELERTCSKGNEWACEELKRVMR
jgi:tetratricopeptide (TPR) repeat protein